MSEKIELHDALQSTPYLRDASSSSPALATLIQRSSVLVPVPSLGDVIVVSIRLKEPDRRQAYSAVKLYLLKEGSRALRILPFRRTLKSMFGRPAFGTWPPEKIEHASCVDGSLSLVFRDPWFPYESPILPFGLDAESEWFARFDGNTSKWSVKHLRFLGPEDTQKHRFSQVRQAELEAIEVDLKSQGLLR